MVASVGKKGDWKGAWERRFGVALNLYLFNHLKTCESENCQNFHYPGCVHLFKVNNANIGATCEISSKPTIKTPKQRQWSRFGVFVVTFELIYYTVLVVPLLNLNKWIPARWYEKKTNTTTAGIYLIKVNKRNTRTRCGICSELIMKTSERRQASGISHLVLVFLLLTLNMRLPAAKDP